jgi:hypothetical protein
MPTKAILQKEIKALQAKIKKPKPKPKRAKVIQRTSKDPYAQAVDRETRGGVFAQLQPLAAHQRGISAVYPGTRQATSVKHSFVSNYTLHSIPFGPSPNHGLCLTFTPSMATCVSQGTVMNVAGTASSSTSHPVEDYSTFLSNYTEFRILACEVAAEAITVEANMGGFIQWAMGDCGSVSILNTFDKIQQDSKYPPIDMSDSSNSSSCVWEANENTVDSTDTEFEPIASYANQFASCIALRSFHTAPHTLTVQVCFHVEFIPAYDKLDIAPTTKTIVDSTLYRERLLAAYGPIPQTSSVRMNRDDFAHSDSTVSSDLKSVFRGLRSGSKLVSKAFNAATGFLGGGFFARRATTAPSPDSDMLAAILMAMPVSTYNHLIRLIRLLRDSPVAFQLQDSKNHAQATTVGCVSALRTAGGAHGSVPTSDIHLATMPHYLKGYDASTSLGRPRVREIHAVLTSLQTALDKHAPGGLLARQNSALLQKTDRMLSASDFITVEF